MPRTPREAMEHPDVRVFTAVTGGRIPGMSQYRTVIEAVRLLRAREKTGRGRAAGIPCAILAGVVEPEAAGWQAV